MNRSKQTIALKHLLMLLLLPLSFGARGQSLEPNYGAPATPLSVANGTATFKIRINGGAAACTGARSLNLTLPTGYVYVAGSASVTAGLGTVSETSSSGNTAALSVSDIPGSPDSTIISYSAYAGCGVIGGSANTINYSLDGCAGAVTATATVNAQNAQLNITSVTNSAYVGTLGDNYTRVITISNDGLGAIDTVYLNSINAGGIAVTGSVASLGTITTTANGYRVTGVALNSGESFTISETVSVNTCVPGTTNFKAWYGPSGTECSVVSNTATAGATVNTSVQPNIVTSVIEQPDYKCLPTTALTGWHTFQLKNTSTVPALFNNLRVYHSNSNYHETVGAVSAVYGIGNNCASRSLYIDTAYGVQYSVDGGANWSDLTYTVFQYWDASSINAGEPISLQFADGIPQLDGGDSVRIRFKAYDDVPNCCEGRWDQARFTFAGNFTDICGNNPRVSPSASANGYNLNIYTFYSESPADAVAGEPYYVTYKGMINSTNNSARNSGDGYIDYEFILPTSLVPSLILADHALTKGTTTILPDNVTFDPATRKLRVRFLRSTIGSSTDYNDWTIRIKTTPDCSGTGDTVIANVYTKMADCAATEWQVACNKTASFTVHGCGSCPDGGANNYPTTAQRTNYGLFSAANDGQPSGTLDTSLLNLEGTMYGDTVAVTTKSLILGTASFSNMYVSYTKSESDDKHQFVDATAYIYNSSTGVLGSTVTGITAGDVTGTNPSTRTISLTSGSGAPTSFAPGDSIVVVTRFRQLVTGDNTVNFATNMYTSNSPLSTGTPQFTCDGNWTGSVKNYSIGIINGNVPTNVFSGCNTASANSLIQFTVGGVGISRHTYFPYEIRTAWSFDTVKVAVPAGFEITNMKVFVQGQGTTAATGIGSYPLLSYNEATNTYYYNLSNLADELVGAGIPFSEGLWLNMQPTYKVKCFTGNFGVFTAMFTVNAKNSTNGVITARTMEQWFSSSDNTMSPLSVSSSSPNVTVNSDSVSWELQVTNATTAVKPNAWLAEGTGVNSISIYNVEELSGSGGSVVGTFSATGGIFQLGNIAATTSKYYRVNATFTNCTTDTTKLVVDYNCDAYPASVLAGEGGCRLQTLPVTVTAQTAALQLAITAQPSGAVDLCDVLDYEIEVTNSGLGAANNLSVRALLPSTGGVEYVLGSYGIKSPSSAASYVTVDDSEVAVVGNNLIFNIPASELGSLPGTGKYKIKFQLKTTPCDFTSGSRFVFRPVGRNGCNAVIQGTAVAGNRINLNGVPPIVPAFTLSSSATSVVACGSGAVSSSYKFKLVNTGSIMTEETDGYRITLPAGWSMNTAVSYSTAPPAGGAYSMSPAAGVYDFYTGEGLAVGDSIVFTTTLSADVSGQTCGLTEPIIESGFVQFTATCADPETTCDTKQLLEPENATTTIDVQRPDYSIGGIDLDEAATAAGSNVIGTLTLNHSNTVYTAQDVTISIYEDMNSNGVQDAGEPLLGSNSYPVADVTSQVISFDVATTVTTPSTKNLVAVATFECACDTPEVSLLSVALPITFIDEKVLSKGCEVNLSWNYAASDVVIHHFSIERKAANQGEWSGIANVPVNQLTYSDEVPYAGQWLYRIKAVNSNNEQAYSRILQANAACDNSSVVLFPNPASTECYLLLEGKDTGKVPYTVTDKLGRVVMSGDLTGNSKNRLNLGHLASGIYRIQFVYGNEHHVKAIDVVK